MKQYNIQNESLIVSYYLNNYDSVSEFLSEFFQDLKLKEVCRVLNIMKNKGLQFSLETLNSFIERNDGIKLTYQELSIIKDTHKDFSNIDYHLLKLREDYQKQIVSSGLLKDLIIKVNSANELKSEELRNKLESILYNLNSLEKPKTILKGSDELAEEYLLELEKRENPDTRRSLGFKVLDDKMVRPAAQKEFTILAASSSVGKTLFKQTMINNLLNKKVCVVNFDLETSQESALDRYMTMNTAIPMLELNKAGLGEQSKLRIIQQLQLLKTKTNYLSSDVAGISFKDIENELVYAKSYFKRKGMLKEDGYIIFFIDGVYMVKDFDSKTPDIIEQALSRLNELVKKTNTHCVGLAQLNENKFRSGKIWSIKDINNYTPSIEDIHGASAYRKYARVVFILHRVKHMRMAMYPKDPSLWLNEDGSSDDIMSCHCVKQSDGELFIQNFDFSGEEMKIRPRMDDINE